MFAPWATASISMLYVSLKFLYAFHYYMLSNKCCCVCAIFHFNDHLYPVPCADVYQEADVKPICVSVRNGKAVTVVDTVDVTMKTFGVPMTKVIGLGSDGASVMASDIRGVNGMMKQLNPFLVFVHCVVHCLNLAVSQACNGISEMAALQNVIAAVYNFVQLSPKQLT